MRACPTCKTPFKSDEIDHCPLDGQKLVEAGGADDPLIGSSIDRFRIDELLGKGGMAAVYRAHHQVIDRQAAVKVIYGEMAQQKEFAERFRREAQTASAIKHPNVVEVLDFGTMPEGATFLTMEFLSGRTLQQAILDDGVFPPERAAAVMRDISAGLQAAHDKGFVHRDLKPSNVMLVEENGRERAKLLDFGLVHRGGGGSGEDASSSTATDKLTHSGQALGTPYYMAPEVIQGGQPTAAADLYSLGGVLYEMIKGEAPFHGSVPELLVKHVTETPRNLDGDSALTLLAKRLLAKTPAERPASASEIIAELDRAFPPPFAESSLSIPVQKPSRVAPAIAAGALLIAAGAIAVAAWPSPEPVAVTEPATDPVADKIAKSRVRWREAWQAALARRGLTLEDARLLDDVAKLMGEWDKIESGEVPGDGENVAQAIIREAARAEIPQKLLEAKLARVELTLERADKPPAELVANLTAAREELGEELSEAERSQLALRLQQIAQSL